MGFDEDRDTIKKIKDTYYKLYLKPRKIMNDDTFQQVVLNIFNNLMQILCPTGKDGEPLTPKEEN